MNSEFTGIIRINGGIRQGNRVIPLLLSLVMDKPIQCLRGIGGHRVRNQLLNIICKGDYEILIARQPMKVLRLST